MSFKIQEAPPTCFAREAAELELFGHAESGISTNICDWVDAIAMKLSPGESFNAHFPPHLLTMNRSMYTPSVSSDKDDISNIKT